ncbi:MiaB/RimO family radical SAM methylthiotransferase [uncultured Campylobacter sp.]|uniref:MiaB/RimO family radical SAM methylthiotransferase n=1 Tax=uncultured Campylobacter sp. TaxID=218934 RepID=UPI00261BB653|nr:MiaB/RimO family radical SAM methylthiotransferase [uncultured Campylobacter sp.]
MAKLHLVSLGCNKNLVDSEIMLGRLQNYELTDEPASADVMIVNTCGFIASAKQESIRTILKLSEQKKSGALLVVTGCLMQRYKDELMRELPEVDIFSGVGDYDKIDEMILKKQNLFSPQTYLQSPALTSSRVITGSNYHAYVKISEGCNQKCSFCAIPSFKGRLKSRSIEDIEAEVRSLVARGFYDFSFIAQDSSSYGRDLRCGNKGGSNFKGSEGELNFAGFRDGQNSDGSSGSAGDKISAQSGLSCGKGSSDESAGDEKAHEQGIDLVALIKRIEKIKGVKVARVLYLYPTSTDERLIRTIVGSPVFANYFDMPIQHINDKMLSLMKRGASAARIKELLNLMRSAPGAFLRTGVIVGHPGETDVEFDELCDFLQEFKFDRISAFAYSKEEDTASFAMPQIPARTISRRLNKIEKITREAIDSSMHALVGKKMPLIIEGASSEGEFFYGAKPLAWDKDIDGEILINESYVQNLKVGGLYECEITEFAGDRLLARVLRSSQGQ